MAFASAGETLVVNGCKAVGVVLVATLSAWSFEKSLEWITVLHASTGLPLLLLGPVLLLTQAYYHGVGQDVSAGMILIFRRLLSGAERSLPRKLLPSILFFSLASHLAGASVGREGVAVQMGASAGDWFSGARKNPLWVVFGMAAGFAALFRLPLVACVFSLEIAWPLLHLKGIYPRVNATLASILGAAGGWGLMGVLTSRWSPLYARPFSGLEWSLKNGAVAVLLGFLLVTLSRIFMGVHHLVRHHASLFSAPIRAVVLLLALWCFFIPSPLHSWLPSVGEPLPGWALHEDAWFHPPDLAIRTFALTFFVMSLLKLFATAVSGGLGFRGGEVFPLMGIGGLAGRSVGILVGAPQSWAALGLSLLFPVAAYLPLTGMALSGELWGAEAVPWAVLIWIGGRVLPPWSRRRRLWERPILENETVASL